MTRKFRLEQKGRDGTLTRAEWIELQRLRQSQEPNPLAILVWNGERYVELLEEHKLRELLNEHEKARHEKEGKDVPCDHCGEMP